MVKGTWVTVVLFITVLFELQCGCEKPYSYQYVRRNYNNFLDDDEVNKWFCVVFGLCGPMMNPGWAAKPELNAVFEWTQLEFDYASPSARQADIDNEVFIPGVPAPIDMDVQYRTQLGQKNRVFVTIPRFQPGMPVTLGVISDKKLNNNPLITPYPSWEWHTNPTQCKPNRLISVYRIQIDECDRLWVLDTGRFGENQTCRPQILAFDLKSDKLLHRYEIPQDLVEPRSILVTPIVDVRDAHGTCRDTFVYVADCQTFSIIVYDVQRGVSWRAIDKTMYPYPNYGTYNILGDSFDLMDGVLGMSLSPYHPGQDRILFYHAMSSPTENWVNTKDLRNQSRFIHDPYSSPEVFHTYRGERNTQSAAEAIDSNGIMYFGLMSDVTIDCWNTNTEYGPRNMEVIAKNKQTSQFASGVKVITNPQNVQELWVLTSRFQKVATGTISSSEVNFRIMIGRVNDLIFSTICKTGRRPSPTTTGGYGLWKSSTRAYATAMNPTKTGYRT